MAWTLETMPEDVSLVKSGPTYVVLDTDRDLYPYSSVVIDLVVTGTINVGEFFTFSYGDISITFTGANPADDSGVQLSTNAGALPIDEYADALAEEFRQNFEIARYFEISRSSGISEHILIKPIDNFTNDFAQSNDMANVTASIIQTGTANFEKNLKIVLLVEEYDTFYSKYKKGKVHILEPVNSRAAFNIAKDFDLQHDFPAASTINSSSFNWNVCANNFVKYRLRYAEQYGEPAEVRALTTNATEKFAVYGSREYPKRLNLWWNSFKASDKFLTLQPNNKRISYEQPEYLYWIARTDPSPAIEMRATATLADGSTVNTSPGASSYFTVYGQIYKFTTQYKQLGFTLDPLNPIVSYKVWMIDSVTTSVITEERNYIIDPKAMDYEKYYAFGNSLAGVETMRGTGKMVESPKYEWQEATLYDAYLGELSAKHSQTYQYNKKEIVTWAGSVGYHSKEYIESLKDALLSDDVRLIDIENKQFIEILVNKGSVNMPKDDDDLYSLEWEYRFAFENYGHEQ